MTPKYYVSIDIGATDIRAMAARIDDQEKIRVLACERKKSDDIRHGVVEQISGAAFKINELIKLLQNSARIPQIDYVAISIGAKGMKSAQITVNRFVGGDKVVTDKLIAQMIDECNKKLENPELTIFDTIPLTYELDGTSMDEPVGKKGVQISATYTVVYGNRIVNERIDRCFDRTGLPIEYSPISSECLSGVLLSDKDREEGCALISLGASTTILSIYREGALQQLQVVPLGGKNITTDIQELGISGNDAEKLKRLMGQAMESYVDQPVYVQVKSKDTPDSLVNISTAFLAKIIEARLEEILMPVLDVINNYPLPLKSIVITGGGAMLNGITDYISANTGMTVRIGNHKGVLAEECWDEFSDPVYSQLIGTIYLTSQYRKQKQDEAQEQESATKPDKSKSKTKLPRNSIKSFFTDRLINFFSDDETKMEDQKTSGSI